MAMTQTRISTHLRALVIERWRRCWRYVFILSLASVVATCVLGPLIPPFRVGYSTDTMVDACELGIWHTIYRRQLSSPTSPALPQDSAALRAQLRSLDYEPGMPMIHWAPGTRFLFWSTIEAGFPFRCAHGWTADDSVTGQRQMGGCIALAEFVAPFTPIWLPLIANVMIFFTAGMLLLSAHTKVRAHERMRAGVCPNCRYELAGGLTGCPECGWNMRT